MSIDSQITPNFNMFASYGFVKTKYIDFPAPTATDPTRNLAGNEFGDAPRHTLSVGGAYDFDNGISFGMDASFTDGSFSSEINDIRADSRLLVNTQMTYEKGDILMGAYVRNLFDNHYITHRFSSLGSPNPNIGRAGEPLTIGAFIQRSF